MKKIVVVLAVAVLGAGVVAARLWLGLSEERERHGELATRLATLESAPAQRSGIPAPVAAPALQSTAVDSPTVAAQASRDEAARSPMAGLLEAMQGPEGRDAMGSMLRSAMLQMYPDVGTELDLTPEEVDKLFDLLVRQQLALTTDSVGLLTGASDATVMQELVRQSAEKEQANQREVAALLGGKYSQWEEYQSTAAARQQVAQLRATLGGSTPLSEAQEKSLVAAFAREQARTEREMREWTASSAAMNSPNMVQESMQRAVEGQRRLVEVAAPILDAGQLGQFRRQVEQQARMLDAMSGMMGGLGATP